MYKIRVFANGVHVVLEYVLDIAFACIIAYHHCIALVLLLLVWFQVFVFRRFKTTLINNYGKFFVARGLLRHKCIAFCE